MSKQVILTGGASGIGRALSEELCRRGAHVLIVDRQIALAEEVVADIRARGGSAEAVELDVREAAALGACVKDFAARRGRLDYIFNNAGIGVSGESKDFDAEDWSEVIDINLCGVINGVRAAYPIMIAQGEGHIVNTASMSGLLPAPFTVSYAASKHALVGLSRSLRAEAKQYGVRVSVLCPGVIDTPMLRGGRFGRVKYEVDWDRMTEEFKRMRPLDPAVYARRSLD
ncbi:MAG: SDR family oxidoreductase, partial [Myxococcales bacterium]|nr:SDR family oxidoreductase [Myxococcales bacterium]